jgi:hypothetical protein
MVNESRIRERDIVLPVLQLIAEFGDPDSGLAVTEITKHLRKRLILSDADREILNGRKDDRFSQVVRNLVSHRTLEKEGLAIYRRGDRFGKGAYLLTPRGKILVGESERFQLDLFRR